ncbi:hypothetical protein WJX74_006634 [Apatococcus lobatus]|uniref:Amidase domain-containing protein n=1 Tax=Apatococcus lobatus TaxID=904363 RepID=A0AAW1RLF5_9CHLO
MQVFGVLTSLLALLVQLPGSAKTQLTGVQTIALPANTPGDALGLAELGTAEAVERLCARNITSVQYATALLQRGHLWECLNAFSEVDVERVLTEAQAVDDRAAAGRDVGPLCGLSIVVKDLYDVANYTTAAGTPSLTGNVPQNNSVLIDKFLAANGVVLGKTRMHELAYGVTSINPFFGPVLNPYNNTCHTGGSSGGTAALIAARATSAGFCSDTGGSCRIPGAMCGTAGFRPTSGCYDAGDGIVPLVPSRDTPGMMARSVEDIILMNSVLSSCNTSIPAVSLSGLRVGFATNWWSQVADESNSAYEQAFTALQEAGVELVDVDFSSVQSFSDQLFPDVSGYTFEMPGAISKYLYRHKSDLSFYTLAEEIASPTVYSTVQGIVEKPAEVYPTLQDYINIFSTYRPQLTAMYNAKYDEAEVDIIMTPMTSVPATPISATEPYTSFKGRYLLNRDLLRVTSVIEPEIGAPGLNIPIGLGETSLPVGLQIQARSGYDNLLLAVGEAMQDVLPQMPPPPAPLCTGCSPQALTQQVTYSGTGPLQNGQTTSAYTLSFEGACPIKSMMQTVLASSAVQDNVNSVVTFD